MPYLYEIERYRGTPARFGKTEISGRFCLLELHEALKYEYNDEQIHEMWDFEIR